MNNKQQRKLHVMVKEAGAKEFVIFSPLQFPSRMYASQHASSRYGANHTKFLRRQSIIDISFHPSNMNTLSKIQSYSQIIGLLFLCDV